MSCARIKFSYSVGRKVFSSGARPPPIQSAQPIIFDFGVDDICGDVNTAIQYMKGNNALSVVL